MKRTVVLALLGLVAAACGGSGGSDHCDVAGEARLCLVERDGGYAVEAQHLKPGSEVRFKVGGGPYGPGTPVAADGTLGGHVVGTLGAQLGVVSAEGVAPDGQRLRVSVEAR